MAVIVVLVLAVVAGVSIWYQTHPPKTAAAPSPSTSAAPVTAGAGDIPNGCLAGRDTSAAALIAAQKKAPHTEAGAVGLAAAFSRWFLQYPRPVAADAEKAVEQLKSQGADKSITDKPNELASSKPLGGWISGGLSFAEGRYIVEDSSADRVKVTVGGAEIKNGLPVPDSKILSTFTLVWESGNWRIASISASRTVEDLFTNGAALAGGC
ncbi:hypothetical protein IV498_10235 [Paenarthrobacter sp. Z7-10]|uniref:hypothetical protein n=1 Tax=Paenarthrobacter sp. Z7-10 TaxID=2787635 RepID=UPI0022A93D04|nr:hypothetical protein [Paenarthrobacter sp. Z7-10]MCZ2403548.1 hypothetical protein [Paenarthrobacter sp. Z7-10]